MRLAKQGGVVRGAKICRNAPLISHLIFADDCLLFGDATEVDALALKRVLEEYEAVSGQVINFENQLHFSLLIPLIWFPTFSGFVHPQSQKNIWDFRILLVGGNNELFRD